MANFSHNHPKPELIYELCGDEVLFFLLAIYPEKI